MTKNILCISTQQFLELSRNESGQVKIEDFVNLINSSAFWHPRDKAETDETMLQIIPYIAILKNINGELNIFIYRRLKKGTETRLHNQYSIGIGGHVDYSLEDADTSPTYMDIVEKSLYREICEELVLSKDNLGDVYPTQIIYDPSNSVGRVHIGLAGLTTTTSDTVRVREIEKLEGQFKSLEHVKEISDSLESWSKILFETIYTRFLGDKSLTSIQIFMLKSLAKSHGLDTNTSYSITETLSLIDPAGHTFTSTVIKDTNNNYFIMKDDFIFLSSEQEVKNLRESQV